MIPQNSYNCFYISVVKIPSETSWFLVVIWIITKIQSYVVIHTSHLHKTLRQNSSTTFEFSC